MEPTRLREFLSQRRRVRAPVVLDGALGTELQRRGFAVDSHPLWSAAALLDEPGRGLVRVIHEDYAAAGADVVTANTFRCNPRLLRRADLLQQGPALVREAVALARAGAPGCLVAGSVSPLESCYTPELVPSARELLAGHQLFAQWMKQSEVDLVLIETINTIREAEAALQAAVDAGLPAVVSFCCRPDGRLLSGERLEDAVAACGGAALALAVNCVAVDGLTAPLEALRASAEGDVGFYANLGSLDAEGTWRPDDAITPERYAQLAETWYQRGFQWVGACCGSRPEHIQELTLRLGHSSHTRKR